MRSPDNAIFTTDLDALTGVDGHQIWDALHKEYPDVNMLQRTRIINHLINEQARGKPMVVTAEYFYRNGLRPKDAIQIIDQDIKGVVTDVKRFSGNVLYFSIDGKIYDVFPQSKIKVWPVGVEVELVAEPEPSTELSLETLHMDQRHYVGRTIECRPSSAIAPIKGVFTDIWRQQTKYVSGARFILVIDGRMHGAAASEKVKLWPTTSRCGWPMGNTTRELAAQEKRCGLDRGHAGFHMQIDKEN